MDLNSGRIYSDAEAAVARDKGEKLVTITQAEADALSIVPEADRPQALFELRRRVAAENAKAGKRFDEAFSARVKTHPLGRTPGLTEDDVRQLRNAGKRARRARRTR